jgi:ubiquinone/menaquinone biosynthesis C-methylase UbiE
MNNSKDHWENVFSTKQAEEVSWTQTYPKTVMDYLAELHLPKTANIIDVGGGEGNFVDALLEKGYQNIWVLDISATALEKTKKRLGSKAQDIHWIVSDITEFQHEIQFDFWYDRAVFHFLNEKENIEKYIQIASDSIKENGHFLLGAFSENGPLKCSGLDIKQYSETTMQEAFKENFKPRKCFKENHTTPFDTIQNFQFCGFTKNKYNRIDQQILLK